MNPTWIPVLELPLAPVLVRDPFSSLRSAFGLLSISPYVVRFLKAPEGEVNLIRVQLHVVELLLKTTWNRWVPVASEDTAEGCQRASLPPLRCWHGTQTFCRPVGEPEHACD